MVVDDIESRGRFYFLRRTVVAAAGGSDLEPTRDVRINRIIYSVAVAPARSGDGTGVFTATAAAVKKRNNTRATNTRRRDIVCLILVLYLTFGIRSKLNKLRATQVRIFDT